MTGASTASSRKRKRNTATKGEVTSSKKRRTGSTKIPCHLTCRICYEDTRLTEFPSTSTRDGRHGTTGETHIPPACQEHLGRKAKAGPVCKTCIGASLVATIESRGAEHTGCFECGMVWNAMYVALYLPPEAMMLYSESALRSSTLSASNFLWCPSPDCTSGGLADKMSNGYPHVECGACKARACAECKVKWHEGQSCQDYQLADSSNMSDAEKKSLEDLIKDGAKRCPRCQIPIVKNGGCSHMLCKCGSFAYSMWVTTFRDTSEPSALNPRHSSIGSS